MDNDTSSIKSDALQFCTPAPEVVVLTISFGHEQEEHCANMIIVVEVADMWSGTQNEIRHTSDTFNFFRFQTVCCICVHSKNWSQGSGVLILGNPDGAPDCTFVC